MLGRLVLERIGIIHPYLRVGGGSEARALWIAEALKDDYDVTLLTMGDPDLNALNSYYGTHLAPDQINILSFRIPRIFRHGFDALRALKLYRYCKNRSSDFDLMISTYNVMDFGKRGIQFIADFSFHDRLRRILHPKKGGINIFYRKSPWRWAYIMLARFLSKSSENGWKRNLTIANSEWSEKIISDTFGVQTKVLFPPVIGSLPDINWRERKNGFVAIGRLVSEKGFDIVIEILKSLRNKGHGIHLHILGPVEDRKYIKKLSNQIEGNEDWIFLEGQKFGHEKMDFMRRHKYGISGCRNEAFGIAVAEMVQSGMIVFVPDSGGQVEIVDHRDLAYENVEDASIKINKVLQDDQLQTELLRHLAVQGKKFSVEIFLSESKKLVQDFFSEKAG